MKREILLRAICALLIGAALFFAKLRHSTAVSVAETAHKAVPCQNCHPINDSEGWRSTRAAGATARCLTCHPTVAVAQPAFHQASNGDCARCHSFHRPEFVRVNEDTLSLVAVKTSGAICDDCHRQGIRPQNISPAHARAARIIHSDLTGSLALQPSQFCLHCHGEQMPEADTSAPRFTLHAGHPYGVPLIPGFRSVDGNLNIRRSLDSRIVAINGRVECQTCHSLSSSERFLLVAKRDNGELCRGCHLVEDETEIFTLVSNRPQ